MNILKVGITGFSGQSFDEVKAQQIIATLFERLQKKNPHKSIEIVSGYTALGVPLIAYQAAVQHNFITVGIASKQSGEYECFPCDKVIIKGELWGDESATFLEYIDCFYKIGGGSQAVKEFEDFKGEKEEFFL